MVQGADSSTSIRRRHEILLDDLVKFDKNAAIFLNHETLEEEFRKIYTDKLRLYSGNHTTLNQKLIKLKCKKLKTVDRGFEALPVYIRHSKEHPGKNRPYKHNQKDLKYSIQFLKRVNIKS